jgi:DNA repair photolyase
MAVVQTTFHSGRVYSLNGIPYNHRAIHGGIDPAMTRESCSGIEGVSRGTYECTVPLIRASRLTSRSRGGIGKNLSEGWCLNFAVGCIHGCPFCYVDSIHKRFGKQRYGNLVSRKWGDYFLVPRNLREAIGDTPWRRWRGIEVMMSSTHDPYLSDLAPYSRSILKTGLAEGVRFCIQTRSHLVERDFDLLAKYRDQVRLQISIATLNKVLARRIEPRAPAPERRIEILNGARRRGIDTGVIIAPIFPPNRVRPDVKGDLAEIAKSLSEVNPNLVFGESLHIRGNNKRLVEEALQEEVALGNGFDKDAGLAFKMALTEHGLQGTWWPEAGHG